MLFYVQLVHSQIATEFEEYIDKQLAEREEKYIKKRSINVPAHPNVCRSSQRHICTLS